MSRKDGEEETCRLFFFIIRSMTENCWICVSRLESGPESCSMSGLFPQMWQKNVKCQVKNGSETYMSMLDAGQSILKFNFQGLGI